MANYRDFTGCKVILRSEGNGQMLGESTILFFDKIQFTITIDAKKLNLMNHEHVSLLILHPDSIFECQGTMRNLGENSRQEIGLFHEQAREGRSAARYELNAPAKVDALIISNKLIKLPEALEVTVVNISKGGVLIRTPKNLFNVKSVFRLNMVVAGSESVVFATVVRSKTTESKEIEYGCKLVFIKEDGDAVQ